MKWLSLIFRLTLSLLSLTSVNFVCAQSGSLLRKAAELSSQGRESEAGPYWVQVWRDKNASKYARIEAGGLLGESYFKAGRYEDAIHTLFDVMEYSDSIGADLEALNVLRYNTSRHLSSLGRYDEAEKLIHAINYEKVSELNFRVANHLAEIESRRGNHRKAIMVIDSLLNDKTVTKYDASGIWRALLIQNRGFVYLELNEAQEAYNSFRQSLALSGTDPIRNIILSNLAMAEAMIGECEKARVHIAASLNCFLDSLGEDSFDYINALRKQAVIAGKCGDVNWSNVAARRFLELEKKRLLRELPEMSEQTRLNYWIREKPLLSSLFSVEGLEATLAADVAIFRRAVSMLGIRNVDELRQILGLTSSSIAKRLSQGEMLIQFVEYTDDKGVSRYDAILTSQSGKTQRIPLFEVEEILHLTVGDKGETLYDAVTGDDPNLINALYTDVELGDLIWQPIFERLSPSVHEIYFVPEGIFHLWGIENMPLPIGSPTLHRLSSVSALIDYNSDPTTEEGKIEIVAGGLDYSAEKKGEDKLFPGDHSTYESLVRVLGVTPGFEIFLPLPATRLEADSVAVSLGHREAMHELSENTFKRLAPQSSLIHLATHGYTLFSGVDEPPRFVADTLAVDTSLLLSGLALSGANRSALDLESAEDGILSARELASLDLSGVDLVVMSACQSGRGLITDEGVSGLVRALKMAGVKTVVASLWEVDDNATRIFMQSFYRGMKSGLSRYEAFESARRTVAETEYKTVIRRFHPGKLRRMPTGEVNISYPYFLPWYNSAFILID